MPLTSTSAMTVSGQFTSWNVSLKNHQWLLSIQIENQSPKYFPKCLQLNQKWEEKKKKKSTGKEKYVFHVFCRVAHVFPCTLPCRQIRLTDGCGFWGNTHAYPHTPTHTHTYTATLTSTHLVHLTCRQHLAWHTMPLERYVFVSHSFPTLPTTAALVLLLFVYLFVVFAFWYLNLACGLATALAW